MGFLSLVVFRDSGSKADPQEMLKTALEWARLDPLPGPIADYTIEQTGGMFSREFHVTFSAKKDDIDRWLIESAGTNEAKLSVGLDGARNFKISPGGGAQYAMVSVQDKTHTVRIRTYWS
jgi:hypothetical protein